MACWVNQRSLEVILDSFNAYDRNWYGQDTYLLTRDSLMGKPKVILDDIGCQPAKRTSI